MPHVLDCSTLVLLIGRIETVGGIPVLRADAPSTEDSNPITNSLARELPRQLVRSVLRVLPSSNQRQVANPIALLSALGGLLALPSDSRIARLSPHRIGYRRLSSRRTNLCWCR